MNRNVYIVLAGVAALLIGCSSNDHAGGESASEPTTVSMEPATKSLAESSNGAGAETEQTAVVVESEHQTVGEANPAERRPMTAAELEAVEAFINGDDSGGYWNYGFLLSGYESPEYVDITMVLYNGAGMPNRDMSEGERAAYIKEVGEIYTDITCLTTDQINTYLQAIAGISINDLKESYDAIYLPEYDTYYFEHGDTNGCIYTCIDGIVEGDIYRVRSSGGWAAADSDCFTTLRRTGDSFQFVSNQFVISADNVPDVSAMNNKARMYINDLTDGYLREPDFNNSIFDTDKRLYTRYELLNIDPYLLEIARNEIYARHGYIFSSSRLKEFFGQFSWYQETYTSDTFPEHLLNQYEKESRELIRSLEIWNQ